MSVTNHENNLDVPLVAPDDFGFPFTPYDIQTSFMRTLFDTVEQGKVGIFESPTGTGKSLSLLCSSVSWLLAHEQRDRQTLQCRLDDLTKQLKDLDASDDWLGVHSQKMKVTERRDETRNLLDQLEQLDEKVREIRERAREAARQKASFGGGDAAQPSSVKSKRPAAAVSMENSDPKSADTDDQDIAPSDDLPSSTTADSQNEEPAVKERQCTKIFFASRTHSQLEQFLKEIQRTKFARNLRVVVLGSRQTLCVNDQVNTLGSVSLINDRCMQMMDSKTPANPCKSAKLDIEDTVGKKNSSGSSCKCAFNNATGISALSDQMLGSVQSVEDVKQLGTKMSACAYYAARNAIKHAQLVLLPYQILLHEGTRQSWGLELEGNVVLVDEAHNLLDAIAATHSVQITKSQLRGALAQLAAYKIRFRSRLNARNLMNVQLLEDVLSKLVTGCDTLDRKAVLDATQFLMKTQLEDTNTYELYSYIEQSQLCRKLFGFSGRYARKREANAGKPPQKCAGCRTNAMKARLKAMTGVQRLKAISKMGGRQIQLDQPDQPCTCIPDLPDFPTGSPLYSIKSFLEALGCAREDGRVLVEDLEKDDVKLRFLLLNPGSRLVPIVSSTCSLILAGGTMKPADELMDTLYRVCGLAESDVVSFTCSHVIDSSQLLTVAVPDGPLSSQSMSFTFDQRGNQRLIHDLAHVIEHTFCLVPGGTVVFYPSYAYMQQLMDVWGRTQVLDRWKKIGRLFFEPRESNRVSAMLSDYTRVVGKGQARAMLNAVVGGKMSEGINFSDNLGRCVIMIGMPYPNKHSPELIEKMKYLCTQTGNTKLGGIYYENLCLRAVNQSIGRAIRHRNDYAVVVLADQRYATSAVQQKLPEWISKDMVASVNFADTQQRVKAFFERQLSSSK